SQTVVVMPEKPGRDDVETLLTLMGRMGESTGYPATRVEVSGPGQLGAMKDKDLLLIGAAPNQRLLETWSDRLPAVIQGTQRHISQPARPANFLYDGFGAPRDARAATRERIDGAGPLAALLGFESPLSAGRSVVAVTAGEARDMAQVLDAL
ncbi:cellulose biosynthesis cyclic di-GMP-binding regulatory protein BcsB, partial [Leptospira sp. SA-E8]|uniref:cellulose biosynthesis cyclic di-GMP-binding regulatory protein BcsB n=1 Tax=Leptospira sp. SA-E8 TaxID=3422259 RepID=UPI003EC0D697